MIYKFMAIRKPPSNPGRPAVYMPSDLWVPDDVARQYRHIPGHNSHGLSLYAARIVADCLYVNDFGRHARHFYVFQDRERK